MFLAGEKASKRRHLRAEAARNYIVTPRVFNLSTSIRVLPRVTSSTTRKLARFPPPPCSHAFGTSESWHPWGGGRSTRGCNSETFSRSSVIFRYFTECFHGNVGELLSTRDGGNSETNDAILETVDGYFRRVSFYRAYRGFDVH